MSRDVTNIIHNSVAAIHGSISAEHGIGLDKKLHFPRNRSEADVELMRQLKKTLDPNSILNRGRIFDQPG